MMNRTEALCKAFGWQGGTIHQLVRETGVSIDDLLYGVPSSIYAGYGYSNGWFAGRNKTINFIQSYGDKDFWIGVAEGLIAQSGGA
jgi:hypothetical protein